MKNSILLLAFSFFILSAASAQKNELMVRSSENGLYLEHKVAPRESFYGIGRMYNVSPRFLASYNKLDLSKGLQIDQKIKVPLTDTNFSQSKGSGTPVYYKTSEKDGWPTITSKHNNVSLDNIRWWNGLTAEELPKKDKKIIIGFLQSKEMPVTTIPGSPEKYESPVRLAAVTNINDVNVEPEDKDKIKEAEKKEAEAELKAEKKEAKKDPPPAIKEERKPAFQDQSYFKKDFDQQIKITPISKDETMTSGIFKTTSGWADAKYYLLADKIAPGTIVKIVNPTNNKAIYAKVLGEMAGIRQNEGFNIRISNAGAAALEISEQDKFILKINY